MRTHTIALIASIALSCGCRPSTPVISLAPEGPLRFEWDATSRTLEIAEADAKHYRVTMNEARPRWMEIASDQKPAGRLIADGRTFSVYTSLDVFCEGHHLDHWTKHMEGKPTLCQPVPKALGMLAESPPAAPSPSETQTPVSSTSAPTPRRTATPAAVETAAGPDSIARDCSCCGHTGGAWISDEHQRANQEAFQACVNRGGRCDGGCPRPPSAAPRR